MEDAHTQPLVAPPPRRHFLKLAGVAGVGGAMATAAGALEPAGAVTSTDPLVFNVKDYGALGNGVANDSAKIRLALEAAVTASTSLYSGLAGPIPVPEQTAGPILYFPAGVYCMPDTTHFPITSPIAIRGSGGAVIDQQITTPPNPLSNVVFRCLASVDVEGIEFRNGGQWFSPQHLETDQTHDIARIRIANCTFRNSNAPLMFMQGENDNFRVGRLEIESNHVIGSSSASANKFTWGFVYVGTKIGSALVTGNRIENVYRYGVRIGIDAGASEDYHEATDLLCAHNTVSGVYQTIGNQSLSTNGIRLQGQRVTLSNNIIADVKTGNGLVGANAIQAEGIYVKGDHVVISDNNLTDAGVDQGQIAVKCSQALVSGNRIVFDANTSGNGIRVEGTEVVVDANEIVNTPTDYHGISVQNKDGDTEMIIITNNVIRGPRAVGASGPIPKRAIISEGRRRMVISGNVISDLKISYEAIGVRSISAVPVDAVIQENTFSNVNLQGTGSYCLTLKASNGTPFANAVVKGNTFHDAARAVQIWREGTGTFTKVYLHGNTYINVPTRLANGQSVPVDTQDYA